MNSFLELPFDMVEEIFKKMDDTTLLAMREVSRTTKDIVQSMVLNRTRQINVEKLIVHKCGNYIESIFEFANEREETLQSKLYFLSVMNYLEFDKFDIERTATSTFFDLITPLLGGARCNIKQLAIPSYHLFKLTSAFLRGKEIPSIRFKYDYSEFAEDYAPLAVREFGSTTASADLERMPSDQFWAELGQSVDTIRICASNEVKRELSCAFFHNSDFACNILRSRCSRLEMDDSLALQLNQMIDLSNELRHEIGDKQFLFSARNPEQFKQNGFNVIIGNHLIHISEQRKNASNLMYMKHVDMKVDGYE